MSAGALLAPGREGFGEGAFARPALFDGEDGNSDGARQGSYPERRKKERVSRGDPGAWPLAVFFTNEKSARSRYRALTDRFGFGYDEVCAISRRAGCVAKALPSV